MAGILSRSRCSTTILTAVALVAAVLIAMPGPFPTSSTASDGVDRAAVSLHAPRVVAHHGVPNEARDVTRHGGPLPARAVASRSTAASALRGHANTGAAPHDSPVAGAYDATGPPECS
jgi:hypothetical protein